MQIHGVPWWLERRRLIPLRHCWWAVVWICFFFFFYHFPSSQTWWWCYIYFYIYISRQKNNTWVGPGLLWCTGAFWACTWLCQGLDVMAVGPKLTRESVRLPVMKVKFRRVTRNKAPLPFSSVLCASHTGDKNRELQHGTFAEAEW